MANGHDDHPPGNQPPGNQPPGNQPPGDQPPGDPPSGGGSGGAQPPDSGPDTSGGEDGDGMSDIGDGWGEGDASLDDVIDNVKIVFKGFQGEILKAWLALFAVVLLVETFEIVVYAIASVGGLLGTTISLVMWPVSSLLGLVTIAVSGVQLALFGPLKARVIDGVDPGSFTTLLKDGATTSLPIIGSVFVLVLADACCCMIPGLILVFFGAMAPYLLATREIGFVDAFKQSYEYAKRHWEVFAVTIGALVATWFITGCCTGVGTTVHSATWSRHYWSIAEILGYGVRQYAWWVAIGIIQIGVFIVWGGVFVTVDAEESGGTVQAP